MNEYYPGYIFHDGDDYPEIAAWCNANKCYIKYQYYNMQVFD